MRVVKVFAAGFLCIITIGCSRPDDLNLAETYFPMGMDYEWTYERDDGGWGVTDFDEWGYPIEGSWHDYDTFTVSVCDSLLITRGWEFELVGGEFRDVGRTQIVTGYKVKVFNRKRFLEPDETDPVDPKGFQILYSDDTLVITLKDGKYCGPENMYKEGTDESTSRLKGIGVINQTRLSYSNGAHTTSGDYITDRLLWFCIGDDTIWHHEDTVSSIIF